MNDQTDRLLAHYAGARAIHKFEHLGETFTIVRYRDADGKHWPDYTALLHDGYSVSDDVTKPPSGSLETLLRRVFTVRESMLAELFSVKLYRSSAFKSTKEFSDGIAKL